MDGSILDMLGNLQGGGQGADLGRLAQLMGMMKKPSGDNKRSGPDMGSLLSLMSLLNQLHPSPQEEPAKDFSPEPTKSPCDDCQEYCPRAKLSLPDYQEARRRAEVCSRF